MASKKRSHSEAVRLMTDKESLQPDRNPYTDKAGAGLSDGNYGVFRERGHASQLKSVDLDERKQEVRHKKWLFRICVALIVIGSLFIFWVVRYAFVAEVDPNAPERLIQDKWNFRVALSAVVVLTASTLRFVITNVWNVGNKSPRGKSDV